MSTFLSFCKMVDKDKNMGTALNLTGFSTDAGSRRTRAALAETREMMQTRAVACGGCKTTVDSQDVAYPVGSKGTRCADIFKSAFKSCKYSLFAFHMPGLSNEPVYR